MISSTLRFSFSFFPNEFQKLNLKRCSDKKKMKNQMILHKILKLSFVLFIKISLKKLFYFRDSARNSLLTLMDAN